MSFKDSVSGFEIPVSPKSSDVVCRALVAAHRERLISDTEYVMAYAEICEPGRYPQAFGGGSMNPERMERWQNLRTFDDGEV